MSAASTAARYRADNGPVVFGCMSCDPPLDVRWNKLTGAVVVEVRGDPSASYRFDGEDGLYVLAALVVAHRRGRMWEAVCDILDPFKERPAWLEAAGEFYRCGRLLLERPSWQTTERRNAA